MVNEDPAEGDPVDPYSEIDTTNWQGVSIDGYGFIHVIVPPATMTKATAVTFATWLLLIADPLDELYPIVRRRIESL